MPDFGLGVTQPIVPWWPGPRHGIGGFGSPFGAFPPPVPPAPAIPVAFTMVIPINIEFKHWASTLVVDFSHDFVPIPPDEANWQDWARDLIQSPTFYGQNAPFPDSFANWQDWAIRLYKAMVPSTSG